MREWPPLDPPRERKGPCPLTPPIGSLYREELHALRNQVRCTWLRHESLRVVTILNRGFQNVEVTLVPDGENRWTWRAEGDNRGMTKKIQDRWYYFEAWL